MPAYIVGEAHTDEVDEEGETVEESEAIEADRAIEKDGRNG